jgi:hypothetical protein
MGDTAKIHLSRSAREVAPRSGAGGSSGWLALGTGSECVLDETAIRHDRGQAAAVVAEDAQITIRVAVNYQ